MKKMRSKRRMKGVLALVLVCLLLPVTAMAAEFRVDSIQLGPKGFTTQLGGMDQAQSVNLAEFKTDGKAGSGTMSWDPATQTITLEDACPAARDEALAVLDFDREPMETVTLHLKGKSVIDTSGNPNADALRFDTHVVIEAEPGASLEIIGDRNGIYLPHGSLTVKSGTLKINVKGTGLNVGGDIVLEKDAVVEVVSQEDAAILAINGTVQIGSGHVSAQSGAKVPAIVGRTSGSTDSTAVPPTRIELAEGLEVKGCRIVTGQWQKAEDGTFYADTVFAPDQTELDENGRLPDGAKVPVRVEITGNGVTPGPDTPDNPEVPGAPDQPSRPDSPNSGDRTPLLPLIIVLVISAAAICVLLIWKSKKNQKK